jgi:fumarate reductase subunit C
MGAPAPARYTLYHPRWYRKRVSTWWWLGRWPYLKFILRELSSVAVAWAVALTLLQVYALARGPHAWERVQAWLRSPLLVFIDAVAFLFVLFHSLTWFALAPAATPVRMKGKRVPDALIAGPNYVAWIVVSIVVGYFILR